MDTVVDISCGDGRQTTRWLAQVAIARYDRTGCQGYMQLGVPTKVYNPTTRDDVPLGDTIKNHFHDGDHVVVETSIGGGPFLTGMADDRRELGGPRVDGASEVSDLSSRPDL